MSRFLFFPVLLLLVACQSTGSATPPVTVAPTQVLLTRTPVPPTSTATASASPSPTASPTITPTPTETPLPIISMVFTGQIVPGRCVQAAVAERGNADFLYDNVRDILTEADFTVGTLNATLTDYPPQTGCVLTFVLIGESKNADAMANAGFDLMSVATNHIKNCGLTSCGDIAFFDTLDNLNRVGILPVGAGSNLADASKPVYATIKGITFGFVSLGEIEPLAFAGETTPGIGVLSNEAIIAAITEAKANADVVIFIPHWGTEYSYKPNPFQLRYAEVAVAAGADLIVGNHAHYVQGYEVLDGVPVFYGLGNFIFDQTQERARQQSLFLRVFFEGDRFAGYDLIPVVSDRDGVAYLADEEEAAAILENLEKVNERLR